MTVVDAVAVQDEIVNSGWELVKKLDRKQTCDVEENKKTLSCAKKSINYRTFKVIIVGDSNVGKTCLAMRFCSGEFPSSTAATIGVDFKEKLMQVDEEYVKLQLWDSAGQERFRCRLVPQYYRNVHAVIFVYDVTHKTSFANLKNWLTELHQNVGVPASIPQLIIGNKCDQHADRAVHTSEARALASSYGLPLWETSAKSDMEKDTIRSIFQCLAETLTLKTPLLDFPPHISNIILADNLKGLRVHQSMSTSTGSKSFDPASKKTKFGQGKCCGVG